MDSRTCAATSACAAPRHVFAIRRCWVCGARTMRHFLRASQDEELKDIMSRRPRLNITGVTYYVLQHGGARRPIFSCEDDYALFESLVVAGLKRHGATAYAYCWTPDAIHLVLRTGDTPIGRLMQGLTSRYARSIH